MTRDEFTMKVRQQAFERCKNFCEMCGANLGIGKYEFDHIIPYFLTQDSSAGNCQVVCIPCHRGEGAKTADDAAIIAKVKRVEAKHNGTWPKSPRKMRSRPFRKRGEP